MGRRVGLVLVPALAAATALTGCGPPVDDARLLMLDEAARAAGTLVQLEGWEGSPAFAVRLKPEERPLVVSQTDARRLDIPARTLAYVEGEDAQVRFLELDREVAPNALVLTAPEGAARQVANLLDAALEPLGGDRYRLSAPELLDRSAFLEPPRGLRDVQPVESGLLSERVFGAQVDRGSLTATFGAPLAGEARDALSLAGIYVGEGKLLVLDAEGGFTLHRGCDAAERGTTYFTEEGIALVSVRAGRELIRLVDGELVDADGQRLQLWREP